MCIGSCSVGWQSRSTGEYFTKKAYLMPVANQIQREILTKTSIFMQNCIEDGNYIGI